MGSVQVGSCDEAYFRTIQHLRADGLQVEAADSLSIGADRKARELLNMEIVIRAPSDRLPAVPSRNFQIVRAIARFVWMAAGSDRLTDIEFYDSGASRFSDDGRTVPGSCFGRRLRSPRPGMDQLVNIIELIREAPATRRASAAIYLPEDAGRRSRDIPCLLSLSYNVRQDGLHATTVMRSNNAYRLLRYNLFETSLLAEVIAAELNVELASLTHYAVSMHLFEDEEMLASETLHSSNRKMRSSPRIPTGSKPLRQVDVLVHYEAVARAIGRHSSASALMGLVDEASEILDGYWLDYLLVLVAGSANRNNLPSVVEFALGRLDGRFGDHLAAELRGQVSNENTPPI